uniref:Reverse transcriptase Ty1/copia-type domain-containing protein n=1 Tax=Peronospora matthiolae TaxID=2874970 RepID=A0AAV1T1T5_9STRA
MTRTAAQKARRNDEESDRPGEEINSVREADPKNYGQAMKIEHVKVILVLALRWGVPARHGDIPNAYVKADKEEHLDIYLAILRVLKI